MRQDALEPELAHPGEERRTAKSAATRSTAKEVKIKYWFKNTKTRKNITY